MLCVIVRQSLILILRDKKNADMMKKHAGERIGF
jgi:hypothetical protein